MWVCRTTWKTNRQRWLNYKIAEKNNIWNKQKVFEDKRIGLEDKWKMY